MSLGEWYLNQKQKPGYLSSLHLTESGGFAPKKSQCNAYFVAIVEPVLLEEKKGFFNQ